MKNIRIIALFLTLLLPFASMSPSIAAEATAKQKLVIQVSDGDAGKWNLALNNAKNVQTAYGADNVDIEIVTYGPGIGMLKMDSAIANRIEDSKKAGVAIVACQNTMKNMKLTADDMLPNTSYVPSGVVELMKKQKEGSEYIRP
jgi:intracellular sulfur oxidation DsrE/DsrF family protein